MRTASARLKLSLAASRHAEGFVVSLESSFGLLLLISFLACVFSLLFSLSSLHFALNLCGQAFLALR